MYRVFKTHFMIVKPFFVPKFPECSEFFLLLVLSIFKCPKKAQYKFVKMFVIIIIKLPFMLIHYMKLTWLNQLCIKVKFRQVKCQRIINTVSICWACTCSVGYTTVWLVVTKRKCTWLIWSTFKWAFPVLGAIFVLVFFKELVGRLCTLYILQQRICIK